MKTEAQRIAIAQACGWIESPYGKWSNGGLVLPDPLNPPDYLNDLNAMHSAENTLSDDQQWDWQNNIVAAMPKRDSDRPLLYTVAHATASYRAEAFLRTIGKWTAE